MLGLGLALALPQYKEQQQEKGLHYELQKGSNSYNEGPSQDNNVKTLPSFDAVKEEAEDTKEPEEDDQESKKCTPIDTACCLAEHHEKQKGESAGKKANMIAVKDPFALTSHLCIVQQYESKVS